MSPSCPTSPCQDSSCGQDSSCVALNSIYFCLCSEGYYYQNNSQKCEEGKIFPGSITVQVPQSDISNLEDKNSKAYEGLHEKFKNAFNYSSNTSEYGQTVIIKVSISPSARSGMYAESIVNVSLVNILIENTKYNQSSVAAIIQNAIDNEDSGIKGYSMKDRCDYYGCKRDGVSNCNNGLQCECKDGYQRPYPQVAVCVASSPVCPDTCNEKNKKQCLLKEDGSISECVCLPGYRDNKGECETCPFGYSGLNCQDQFQLILTIVGTIAGILIIGMVIAFIVSSRLKNKRKDGEEQNLIENDFQNLKLQQTGFTNFGADGSIFPKVQTMASKDRQLQNPYINTGSMPHPDY
ncbi:PREDICTED: mucin-13 [Chrysochloris asiatica]|uniref:Mucin-13 n=1 Tax=Chrysochloris asiatica TaxID=185453 RepID=A0A9B0WVI0_CHRAS|nr:PREDICTED: mucin-13 [Chrysochloris asiatica]